MLRTSSTPILDLQRDPPKLPARSVSLVLGVALGLVTGSLLILNDEGMLPVWNWPECNGLLLLPVFYVCVACHELGHLLIGRLFGMRSGALSIGPLLFYKSGEKWSFQFQWRAPLSGFFKPLTEPGSSLTACAWMIAGGPLASLFQAVIGFGFWLLWPYQVWHLAGTFVWVAFFTFVFTAAPLTSGSVKSDGARLWQFLRNPKEAGVWMAVLELQSSESRGVRPRDWDPHLFRQLLSVPPKAGEYPICQLWAYYRRIDEKQEQLALVHLENGLAGLRTRSKQTRQILFMEAADASAMIRGDVEQARTWRERACKLQKPESLHTVDAAIAMCEGRLDDAANHWQAARELVLRRKLDSGIIHFALEQWRQAEAECRASSVLHA